VTRPSAVPRTDLRAEKARARRTNRRIIFVMALVGTAVAAAGGAAWADWSGSGTGQGTAKADSFQTVTVETVTFSSDVYPGGPAVPVDIKFTNPNNFSVTIDSVTAGTTTSSNLGCGDTGNPTGVSFDLSTIVGTLEPGETTLVAAALMDTTSVSACQGATFSTPLTLVVGR
jgi:hypothetical protein